MRFFCFISVCTLLTAPLGFAAGAGGKGVSAPSVVPTISIVKIGPDGHLIRVRRPIRSADTPFQPARPKIRTSITAAAPNVPYKPTIDETIQQVVDEAANRYNVDPLLVKSVIRAESGFNPFAVSPKGAQGLMQLIPATAHRFGVDNPFDVKKNVEGGVKYLSYLQGLFPGNPNLAIAAYNAGEGAVFRYNSIPPYPETIAYVERVHQHYSSQRRAQLPPELAAAAAPQEESVHHIQQFFDSEGRLYLVTR